ncbi:carotene hydroxylase [Cryomorpha ignava]|uniref:Carotene hydroxylase n=1 Tax=Cryomorpha ignava TaxID=101383 RepID=A0A7K3WMG1_9FLAO|nr:sterol desaturase family protein [Cryomorpha ignava]NEN22072.1 carotene hydroxylase [Cryomorpha ignava]
MDWIYVLLIFSTFFFMEFMAWFTHKYVMHGIGWYFHKDHHQHKPGFFEKNDVFFLIFAIPSMLLILFGVLAGNDWRLFMGIGIALYGASYFLIHDVFIHQRLPWLKRTDNVYLRAIRKAHKVHHKHLGKEEGECFGMLLVPIEYFRAAKKAIA